MIFLSLLLLVGDSLKLSYKVDKKFNLSRHLNEILKFIIDEQAKFYKLSLLYYKLRCILIYENNNKIST